MTNQIEPVSPDEGICPRCGFAMMAADCVTRAATGEKLPSWTCMACSRDVHWQRSDTTKKPGEFADLRQK